MTQTKTHSVWARAWHKVMLAGAREIDQMRNRSGPRCPNCGGQLLRRKVGFGENAGKEFWDCSNVPKCFTSIAAEALDWPQSPFSATA
jgi:ssDNA-binding Zn-finger/Zn-ribbon topoisomerase 1